MADQQYTVSQSHSESKNIWTVTVMRKGTYVIEYHIFRESAGVWSVRMPTDLSRSLYSASSLGEAVGHIVNQEES